MSFATKLILEMAGIRAKLGPPIPQQTIMANPFWRAALRCPEIAAQNLGVGVPIVYDSAIPKYALRWQFPNERFIEYEKSDERWCRYFRIGRDVETNVPLFYVMNMPDWSVPPKITWY